MKRFWRLIQIFALAAAAAGCAAAYNPLASFLPPSNVAARTVPEIGAYKVRRIAVLRFRNESGVPAAGEKMAGMFYEQLASATRYEVHPPPKEAEGEDFRFEFRRRDGRAEGVRNEALEAAWLKEKVNRFVATVEPYLTTLDLVYPGEYFEGRLEEKGKRGRVSGTVAKAGGAGNQPEFDAVITGIITRYRNRSGFEYAGDKGAHVAYTVFMVSVKDGKVLWRAHFDEEQHFLSDNLILLPRYAREAFSWQTNETLARHGLERVLKTFPGLKPAAPTEEYGGQF